MKIRPITLKDYHKISTFWKKHYKFSNRDTRQKIKILLAKNPGLSILAEKNGEIIGTTLASFDGRKGYLQKIVIRKDFQGGGLGKELVKIAILSLQKAGALDIRVNCDKKLVPFYKKCGFKESGVIALKIKLY